MKPKQESIYDRDVVGPDELSIGGEMQNKDWIANWWEDAKLYTKAMGALDRGVLLHYVPDENRFYLSSLPEAL